MNCFKKMSAACFLCLLIFFVTKALAAEEVREGLQLAKAPISYTDTASIKRGAKFFATNCATCHTMAYLRFDPIAKEAGLNPNKAPIALNGVVPPDLSLEADIKGVNWIYTYLHSFYKDPKTPTGVNNLLVPGTAMPAILSPFQGEQVLVEQPNYDMLHQVEWFDLVKPVTQGSMKPEEFNQTMDDLVNFLAYAAEPFRAKQHRIGYGVLIFLIILFVLMYFLKKEYWKDVKKM